MVCEPQLIAARKLHAREDTVRSTEQASFVDCGKVNVSPEVNLAGCQFIAHFFAVGAGGIGGAGGGVIGAGASTPSTPRACAKMS